MARILNGIIVTWAALALLLLVVIELTHPIITQFLYYPALLGLVVLFACSIIPIGVLQILRTHFPDVFPPRKFVA